MSITFSTLKQKFQTTIHDREGTYAYLYDDAINNAARELSAKKILHKSLIDETLITGNLLPPFIWTSSSALALYSTSNVTLTKTTTGGLYRNGLTSAKATASAGDGYLMLSSDNYPRLLDLMDLEVDYKCWAYPEVADDGFLTLYTLQADGTAQTLNSTTSCPATKFTLLELEDQDLNDDLVKIEARMRVHTNAKYVYFDPPRLTGKGVQDYMLPDDFQDGHVSQVWLQSSAYSDDACDDLKPRYTEEFGWKVINDGSYKYLHMPYIPTSGKKIKLVGYCPLESDLSADTDTMAIDDSYTPRLLTYAAYLMYQMLEDDVSSDDINRYERASLKWYGRSSLLGRMPKPSEAISWSL